MLRKAVLVAGLLRAFGSISFSFAAYVLRAEGGHRQAKAVGLQLCTMLLIALNCVALAADPNKTLHIAMQDINTLDPQQANEAYSFRVIEAIYENLYELDYLSQPAKLVPNTAVALPEIADGGLTWTIRVRPGIYFTIDPAFKGRPRELVAEDYVYSVKRLLDPGLRLGGDALMTDLIVDARDAVAAAKKPGARFDYDRPLKGIQALDRYSFQLRLNEVNYPLVEKFLEETLAVAREVVEAEHGNIQAHPVGTGPYRLKEWKRGSRIVLEVNERYRAIRFPTSTDPEMAELVRSMEGKNLPQIGTIEISFIAEDLPALLEFDGGKLDYVTLGGAVIARLLVNGKLAPVYASHGMRHYAYPDESLTAVYFNLNDPVVGGLDPQRIALRRAIGLGLDIDALIKTVYNGQALPADQLVPPGLEGHDPNVPDKSRYDPAAANALLDRFGYNKRDSEGYRSAPDGKPLTVTYSTRLGSQVRDEEALWKKNMDAIGLRMHFHERPVQDILKEQDTGQFQISSRTVSGAYAGFVILVQLFSKTSSSLNIARFHLPDYDRAMQQFTRTNVGSDRIAAARKMSELTRYYAPIIPISYRLNNDFVHPWVKGFHPSTLSAGNYWKYLDIDLAARR